MKFGDDDSGGSGDVRRYRVLEILSRIVGEACRIEYSVQPVLSIDGTETQLTDASRGVGANVTKPEQLPLFSSFSFPFLKFRQFRFRQNVGFRCGSDDPCAIRECENSRCLGPCDRDQWRARGCLLR